MNITLNTVGGVATGTTVTSVLNTLNAAGLDPSVQALLNSVNALLFGLDEGILSGVTNSLGIDATVNVTGSISLNQRTPSGNGVSTTGMDVLMLDVNLNVSIALELALTSNVTVAQCTEVFPGLLGLTRCLVGNLAGSLLEAVGDLIDTNNLLGNTLQGILNQLGIGFGQSGQLNQNSNATVNIGVIDLEIAQARSAIAGFTVSTPPPGSTSTPTSVPTTAPTNTPGPGSPTATATSKPRPGTPTTTNTPGPGAPQATNTPRPGAPQVPSTPVPSAPTNTPGPGGFATNTPGPSGPPGGIATPRPPATGSATADETGSSLQLIWLVGTMVIIGSAASFAAARGRRAN